MKLLFVAAHRLLTAVTSLVVERWRYSTGASGVAAPGLQSTGSGVVVHRLSCASACGIFPDQESDPYPLPWQKVSHPLCHQGSPIKAVLRLSVKPLYKLILAIRCPLLPKGGAGMAALTQRTRGSSESDKSWVTGEDTSSVRISLKESRL